MGWEGCARRIGGRGAVGGGGGGARREAACGGYGGGVCDRGGGRYGGRSRDRADTEVPKPLILLLCLVAAPAFAQPRELPAGIGAGGQAYVDAVRGSGAQTAVTYFDPVRSAPELRTDVAVEPPPDRKSTRLNSSH